MSVILQKTLPFAPWMQAHTTKLPGIQPIKLEEWLQVDEVYTEQLLEKVKILDNKLDQAYVMAPECIPAAEELLSLIITLLPDLGFVISGKKVRRPDGLEILIDIKKPLITLSKLLQEDFLIMTEKAGEHVLIGGCLCFPASWDLLEKFMKPLTLIHSPVPVYDESLAKRVERLLSSVRSEIPLMRGNTLRYTNPTLFLPKRNSDPERKEVRGDYIRSERQTLVRLPKTKAVVFSIHTYVIKEEDLTSSQKAGLQKLGPLLPYENP